MNNKICVLSFPCLFSVEGTNFVVNCDKAFTNGNFLNPVFGAYESAIMDFKEKISQRLTTFEQEATGKYRWQQNDEVGEDSLVTYP